MRLPILDASTAKTGRPRAVPLHALLTLMATHVLLNQNSLRLTDIARTYDRLTTAQRLDVGLPRCSYSTIESGLADLARILTDSAAGIDLVEFATRIVAATIPDWLPPSPDQAIDSTDYPTWARHRSWSTRADAVDTPPDVLTGEDAGWSERGWPRKGADGRAQHTADPDARAGFRSKKTDSNSNVFVGYDLHISVDVALTGQPFRPALARAMCLTPAGSSKASAGPATIDTHRRVSKCTIATLLADRGYSYLTAESWALRLWDRGINPVFDLHTNQFGTHPGPTPGTIWVDGALFTTALPERFRRLPRFTLSMTTEDKAALQGQYDKRAKYAFTPLTTRDPSTLTQRVKGPALAGRVSCPNVPSSRHMASRRPLTNCRPGEPCGCGITLTLGPEPDHHPKDRQHHLYGTSRWAADYGRRVAVESYNAELKTHRGNLTRGLTRVFGTAKNAILLAFYLGAVNTRIITDTYPAHPQPHGVVTHTPVRPRRPRNTARHRTLTTLRSPPDHTPAPTTPAHTA